MPKPGLSVDVLIKDAGWTDIVSEVEAHCLHIIDRVSAALALPGTGELSVALVDDAEIQTLNAQYRHKNKPTNVLSFRASGPDSAAGNMLGDIVIARETVAREAAAANVTVENHLAHMLVHGFLHLHGYDHENGVDADIMEALEIKALRALNIDNPYKINEPSPT